MILVIYLLYCYVFEAIHQCLQITLKQYQR